MNSQVAGVIIAILALVGSFLVPEVRQFLGIERKSESASSPIVARTAAAPVEPAPTPIPPPTTRATKILITGSKNDLYFYWASIPFSTHPIVVDTNGEHTHLEVPDGYPVEIEFTTASRGNNVWHRGGPEMVTKVTGGNGLRGNTVHANSTH